MKSKIRRVLLVDDDPNMRLITRISVEGLTEWELTIATSGHEALSLSAQALPDLVLLDMMMPDMDGMTVFSELKKRFGDKTPAVIFMTAKVQIQEVQNYKNVGAAGVIMKPFDPMKLPDEIVAILDSCPAS